jgi:hypothetical protein
MDALTTTLIEETTVGIITTRSRILALTFCLVTPPALASQMPEYQMTVHVEPSTPRLDVQGTMRVRLAPAEHTPAHVTLSGIMHDVHIDIVEPHAFAAPLVRTTTSDTSTWTAELPSTVAGGQEVLLRFRCSTDQPDAFLFPWWHPEKHAGSIAGRTRRSPRSP